MPARRVLIQVSPEMITLIGAGALDPASWPEQPVAFSFAIGDPSATLAYHGPADAATLEAVEASLLLIVARSACQRIFGSLPPEGAFHAPPTLRGIAAAILGCTLAEPARTTLRLAKAIELLCETFQLLGSDALIATARDAQLSYGDCERIRAARRLVETRWNEKLTLDSIAAACGLNRSKLARGFRDLFNHSVGGLLAEQRLSAAQQMLLATELPISSIGYRCGYGTNAAFTRAFSRRYGMAPSGFRAASLNT
ncbi:helix-turn-helix transcriptional regulator [Sphingomonas glaciei]|uniref:AraC family transcriptional regulator n=1 Tax=Sphingomonas glaciei TaxID=2938948 RepID=A0ABY5MVV9_9SPHN|nr:AraC family transcriptional regulator [Sphingomonas glaciei]UUR08114.1 AraC family transcriptional regulator [Sphingomonas glaciei]